MTVSRSRIQSRTTTAMRCDAQNRRASTLTNPPQPAMTMATGILAPASYLRRRSPSWTKSDPPLTERLALSASIVTTRDLTARRAPQKASELCVGDGVDDMRSGLGCRPRLRRWTKPLMLSQVALKRRPCIWPGSHRSIVLVRPERRRFAFAYRRDDRRRVEWITSWTPHGARPHLFYR